MTTNVTVRDAYPRPHHPSQPLGTSSRSSRVTLKHPGYGERGATLFTVSACDGPRRDHVNYHFLRDFCIFLTGGRDDVWFSSDIDGKHDILGDEHGLVVDGIHFLNVPVVNERPDQPRESDKSYPIVPNFRIWSFLHNSMPQHWQQARSCSSQGLPELPSNTRECRLTRHSLKVQQAHIIPSSERLWFATNEMGQYGEVSGRGGQDVINQSQNIIGLRADVHQLWDEHEFVIRPTIKAGGGVVFYAHAMTDHQEVIELYHLVTLQHLSCAPEYLLARAAYAFFPKILGFLQTGKPRWLLVPASDDSGAMTKRMCDGAECLEYTMNQGLGRSSSPVKRSRRNSQVETIVNSDVEDSDVRGSKRVQTSTPGVHSVDSGIAGILPTSPSASCSDLDDDAVLGENDVVDLGERFDASPTGCRRKEESPDPHPLASRIWYSSSLLDETSPRGRKRKR